MNEDPAPAFSDREYVRTMLVRIRAQRLSRNWSQAELARRAGMARASYQNLEGGFGNPTLANLLRVLSILGLSHRLADLVPEVEVAQTIASLTSKRERTRASGLRRKPHRTQ